jgi:hypothetical protein
VKQDVHHAEEAGFSILGYGLEWQLREFLSEASSHP